MSPAAIIMTLGFNNVFMFDVLLLNVSLITEVGSFQYSFVWLGPDAKKSIDTIGGYAGTICVPYIYIVFCLQSVMSLDKKRWPLARKSQCPSLYFFSKNERRELRFHLSRYLSSSGIEALRADDRCRTCIRPLADSVSGVGSICQPDHCSHLLPR